MNRKAILLLAIGLLLILTGVWSYPKIERFFKVDTCLDSGGRWNYDTQRCEMSDTSKIKNTSTDSLKGYNQLADEQNRNSYTISEYNTDLKEARNITRPKRTAIVNPSIDTAQLFKIWTLDPSGPHADFWFKRSEFYVVDYDGDGAMPYILDGDILTVFYNDFIQKGKIISVGKNALKIHWNESDRPTEYVEWKN
jgi:hypothetical protein